MDGKTSSDICDETVDKFSEFMKMIEETLYLSEIDRIYFKGLMKLIPVVIHFASPVWFDWAKPAVSIVQSAVEP